MILLRIGQGVQALRLFGALPVDDQVARNGEEPGLEFRFAVVLMATLEHADPGFLEKVLGAFGTAGDVHEITEEAVLILLDQAVEQIRVAPLQATGDGPGVIAHKRGEKTGWPRRGQT